jgi:hypothetical protein
VFAGVVVFGAKIEEAGAAEDAGAEGANLIGVLEGFQV